MPAAAERSRSATEQQIPAGCCQCVCACEGVRGSVRLWWWWCGGVWLVQEALYGKPIVTAERETVESTAETDILTPALTEDVALLVVGDALW